MYAIVSVNRWEKVKITSSDLIFEALPPVECDLFTKTTYILKVENLFYIRFFKIKNKTLNHSTIKK